MSEKTATIYTDGTKIIKYEIKTKHNQIVNWRYA